MGMVSVENSNDILEKMKKKQEEEKRNKPVGKKNNITITGMSSIEYAKTHKPKGFLIDRLIYENSLGMLVAPSKCNKSTLAYNIALAVATGIPCI